MFCLILHSKALRMKSEAMLGPKVKGPLPYPYSKKDVIAWICIAMNLKSQMGQGVLHNMNARRVQDPPNDEKRT